MNTKNKERESLWQKQLDETLDKIANREPFSYDVNGDKLYEHYKNHYQKQGQLAMENAIGQASALTGGYANSYAQMVGQQAYQDQMDNLNAIVPDLYQNAMDRYMAEENNLYERASLLQGLLKNDEDDSLVDEPPYIIDKETDEAFAQMTQPQAAEWIEDQIQEGMDTEIADALIDRYFANAIWSPESDNTLNQKNWSLHGLGTGRDNDDFWITIGDEKYHVNSGEKINDAELIHKLNKLATGRTDTTPSVSAETKFGAMFGTDNRASGEKKSGKLVVLNGKMYVYTFSGWHEVKDNGNNGNSQKAIDAYLKASK
jgi:hypothetical protein